jgi:hypothetical protein
MWRCHKIILIPYFGFSPTFFFDDLYPQWFVPRRKGRGLMADA